MKTITIVYALLVVFVTLFSGCANTITTETRSMTDAELATYKDKIPNYDPRNASKNREVVKEVIVEKLNRLEGKSLLAVNQFLDQIALAKGDPKKEVVVMVVESKKFPPLLEEILAGHPKLSTLPRDPKTLFVLENKKSPGVKNIFIEVPARLMGDGLVTDWLPKNQEWQKYIDLQANRLMDVDAGKAYLTLFWMGNNEWNQELIASVEGSYLPPEMQWKWSRMLHPRDTKVGKMYIPVATMTQSLAPFF